MSERLLSVGLDVGTTSTQMILSELTVENQAGSFSVPKMEIAGRKILYKSEVHFTPLLSGDLVDAGALRKIVEADYRAAGIRREDVDTGAIIITGETSRKENARAVMEELSGFAGEFVVATAGPHLESVLAAKGAGAVEYAQQTGKTVLHMDIGGGTSNLAWIQDGRILHTGCLNVGGRLIKFDGKGVVTYVSPVLKDLCTLRPGDRAEQKQIEAVCERLVEALEMAAGLRTPAEILNRLWTREAGAVWETVPGETVISFSGGVADCIGQDVPWLAYGDIGPILGRKIRNSRLCRNAYVLGKETIRATVIGAGCHTTQLSGSTVYYQNLTFPLQNIPVVCISLSEQSGEDLAATVRQKLRRQEETAVLALPGLAAPGYEAVRQLADAIASGTEDGALLVCLEQDMAKALGQALAVRCGNDRPVLCIDRVSLSEGSYLDVGTPVGPALPVVVKTLVLER